MIAEPKRDIQIWPLIRLGLARCWVARDQLIRLGVIPLLAVFLIRIPWQDELLAVLRDTTEGGIPDHSALVARISLLGLCYFAVTALFAVNWLRQLTLGAAAAPGLGVTLSARHFRFLVLMLAITILATIPILILTVVLSPLGMVGMLTALMLGVIAWTVLVARLSPSWIGIAIDVPMPIGIAWRRTAGQGFKLMLALLMIEIPVMFAQLLLGEILQATGLADAAPYTLLLLMSAASLVRFAVQLAVLVAAFPFFLQETV